MGGEGEDMKGETPSRKRNYRNEGFSRERVAENTTSPADRFLRPAMQGLKIKKKKRPSTIFRGGRRIHESLLV